MDSIQKYHRPVTDQIRSRINNKSPLSLSVIEKGLRSHLFRSLARVQAPKKLCFAHGQQMRVQISRAKKEDDAQLQQQV
ncbi:hypothetical protein VTL71DRAFT_16295 [Oculimacula yallundae]|uniref:Uncharacterized protein n=1 Tax=Oculimacula yallundae TaxID=86028 RepID=A0ABR4CE20_9HELO